MSSSEVEKWFKERKHFLPKICPNCKDENCLIPVIKGEPGVILLNFIKLGELMEVDLLKYPRENSFCKKCKIIAYNENPISFVCNNSHQLI